MVGKKGAKGSYPDHAAVAPEKISEMKGVTEPERGHMEVRDIDRRETAAAVSVLESELGFAHGRSHGDQAAAGSRRRHGRHEGCPRCRR